MEILIILLPMVAGATVLGYILAWLSNPDR